MRYHRIWAVLLAAAVSASLSACGKGSTESEENSTSAASEAETTALPTEADTTKPTASVPESPDSIKVYYGWGTEDEKYYAEIFCPEGAAFSEDTLETAEDDGSVMTASLTDEVKQYAVSSRMHWHRDAYNNEPTAYPIIAQLYFDGKLDDKTAADHTGCNQNVTPLGFTWNGYDVVLIETTYTFMDYGEQTELFAGVEYDLDYWKTEEGTGKVMDLTTKALFGFELNSLGDEALTQEQWAWVISALFGVETGMADPFAKESAAPPAAVAQSALVGEWIDRTSDWEDTYVFADDGTGSYTSGFEYAFTYEVEGDTLTVTYEEDDVDRFTVSVEDGVLILVDEFGYEQRFGKNETAEETTVPEESTPAEEAHPYVKAVLGTWKESETGIDETFRFDADGTGHYSCLVEDGLYECEFTYSFLRSDYIEMVYNDGTEGGFQIVIEGDTMTVRNEYAWDLAYTRQ